VEIKMSRYIAENDVYNLFNARGVAQLHVGDIDVLPRVIFTPKIEADWILEREKDTFGYTIHWKCSNCQKRAETPYDYCPHCGAKME